MEGREGGRSQAWESGQELRCCLVTVGKLVSIAVESADGRMGRAGRRKSWACLWGVLEGGDLRREENITNCAFHVRLGRRMAAKKASLSPAGAT